MKTMKHIIFLGLLMVCIHAVAVPPRDPALRDRYEQSEVAKAERRITQEQMVVGTRKTFPRVPVIMVSYQDIKYRLSRAEIDSLFNAQQRAAGSVKSYFKSQSNNAYAPVFDIYGPVTVSKGTSAYAKNASALVKEACSLMNDSLDFTKYDTDQDGKVDLVYILYAGPPASDENYIDPAWIANPSTLVWPHYSTITQSSQYDGKSLRDYEVSSELTGVGSSATVANISDLGLVCHEFGHGLGLPDIYDPKSGSHKTLGMWDIMDYGCYNTMPSNYTIYERWFMNWVTPRLINTAQDITLHPIANGGEGLLITKTGQSNMNGLSPSPTEFWLLENRQPTGWDISIPGQGLLIYHVKYDASKWSGNSVNSTATNMGFDLVEADGSAPNYSASDTTGAWFGKPGDAFPCGATYYTPCTNYPITDITETDGVISFKFMGGTTTHLNMTNINNTHPAKIYHNGILYIRRGDQWYLVDGQIVNL